MPSDNAKAIQNRIAELRVIADLAERVANETAQEAKAYCHDDLMLDDALYHIRRMLFWLNASQESVGIYSIDNRRMWHEENEKAKEGASE